MCLEKSLKRASIEDPESLEDLYRELERRGFKKELIVLTVHEKLLRHPEVDHSLLRKWVSYFNERDPSKDRFSFRDMPEGGNYRTKKAFLSLLEEKGYEIRVHRRDSGYVERVCHLQEFQEISLFRAD